MSRFLQSGHHRHIGRRHWIRSELVVRHPSQSLVFHAAWLAGVFSDLEYIQLDAFIAGMLRHRHQRLGGQHIDAELFFQFALECFFCRFMTLDFAAGKFPGAGQVAPADTPRQQHAAAGIGQYAGGYGNNSGGGYTGSSH